MSLIKTTLNKINISEIVEMKLHESDNHIELAKYIGSKYLDFSDEEAAWIDVFWEVTYNKEWILITKDILSNHFGYAVEQNIYYNYNDMLRRKFIENQDYHEVYADHYLVQQYKLTNNQKRGGHLRRYYIITGETYKTCCMTAQTEIGKRTRSYFLKMETLANIALKVVSECIRLQLNRKISEKDDKIDDLSKKIDQLLIKADETINHAKDIKVDLDISNSHLEETKAKLSDVNDKLVDTNEKLTETNIKLGIAVKTRVVASDNAKLERFIMFENPKGSEYQFYVMRRQANGIQSHIKKYLNDHEGSSVFIDIEEQPNSRNLVYRIKEKLKSYIECKMNSFSIRDNCMTKDDFRKAILDIHGERLDV